MNKKILTLIFTITFLLTGCANENNGNTPSPTAAPTEAPTDTDNTNPTNAPTDTSDKDKEVQESYKVGEMADINGIKIVLSSVEKSYGDKDEEFSAFAPADGKVFVICNFEVENNSDSDLNISSLYFNAYEDGYSTDEYIFASGINVDDLNGTASPGKRIKGALVYELSEDFEELELEYEPSIWDNVKTIFVVRNNDIQ